MSSLSLERCVVVFFVVVLFFCDVGYFTQVVSNGALPKFLNK